MFKLIFRTINIIVLLTILTIGLAFWKGGEPFRWVGDGMVTIGEKVSDVGDLVDEMIDGGKKVQKSYKELKEVIEPKE
ncbi:hypothetical protein BMS3Bbin09_00009 [bacterium BMS3Bbin09]|nr:hypothetical protein BMS3Bbin09_00009 [bacterium BMS3Bbin09]HDH33846.1 hypothetical protein [Nitrospirota bacterium]